MDLSPFPKLNKPPPFFSVLVVLFEFPLELKLNNEFEGAVLDGMLEPLKRPPPVPLNKGAFCLFSSFFSCGLSLFLLIKLLNMDVVLLLKLILFSFSFLFSDFFSPKRPLLAPNNGLFSLLVLSLALMPNNGFVSFLLLLFSLLPNKDLKSFLLLSLSLLPNKGLASFLLLSLLLNNYLLLLSSSLLFLKLPKFTFKLFEAFMP